MGIEKKYYFSLGRSEQNAKTPQTLTHDAANIEPQAFGNSEKRSNKATKKTARTPDLSALSNHPTADREALSTPDQGGSSASTPDNEGGHGSGAFAIKEDHPPLAPTPFGPAVLPGYALHGSLADDWYRGKEYWGKPSSKFDPL